MSEELQQEEEPKGTTDNSCFFILCECISSSFPSAVKKKGGIIVSEMSDLVRVAKELENLILSALRAASPLLTLSLLKAQHIQVTVDWHLLTKHC